MTKIVKARIADILTTNNGEKIVVEDSDDDDSDSNVDAGLGLVKRQKIAMTCPPSPKLGSPWSIQNY